MKYGAMLLIALLSVSCSRVTYKFSDSEGSHHITLPFSALQAALALSDDGDFQIEDLGGVDESFDLRAIAKAMREPGAEKISFSMNSNDQKIDARIQGKALSIETSAEDTSDRVTIHLPLSLLDLFANTESNPVTVNQVLSAIKRQKGVFLDIVDEEGRRQIIIK